MTIPFGATLEHLTNKDDTPEDVGLGILSGIIMNNQSVCLRTIYKLFGHSLSFGRPLGLQRLNKKGDSGARTEHNWNNKLTAHDANTKRNTVFKQTKGTDTRLRIRNIILRTIYLFSEFRSPLPPYHAI